MNKASKISMIAIVASIALGFVLAVVAAGMGGIQTSQAMKAPGFTQGSSVPAEPNPLAVTAAATPLNR